MHRRSVKAAELASGVGAIVLGSGLALFAPPTWREMAAPSFITGVLVHGAGMTLKHRLEVRSGMMLWWEKVLFWVCWAALAVLAAWMGAIAFFT
ncbi:MAG: hypothetical protein HY854_23155 [Burkholderiales bacterium]|nr:hypothetical protein [Burkholderiales bacterium]